MLDKEIKKKMLQFGAENIGRSFIGQLFSRSGYEVVFVDINKELVRELNKKRAYKLVIKRNEPPDEIILIENIRAIDGYDKEAVVREIVDTDIIATAVGKYALPQIIPVITQGIQLRYKKREYNLTKIFHIFQMGEFYGYSCCRSYLFRYYSGLEDWRY